MHTLLLWMLRQSWNATATLASSALQDKKFPVREKLQHISIRRTMLSKTWDVLGPSRFDNPCTFIWRYSFRKHSTFLDYLKKLSHCLFNVTGIRVQYQISLAQIFKCYVGRQLFESIMITVQIFCKLTCWA